MMILGRETAGPLEVKFGRAPTMPKCPHEYVTWLRDVLCYTHERARLTLGTQLASQKFYHDRRLKHREFKVGDKVLWLEPVKRKLRAAWQGPFVVTKCMEERHHYIIEAQEKSRRATAEQLRPFTENTDHADIHFLVGATETGDTGQAGDNRTRQIEDDDEIDREGLYALERLRLPGTNPATLIRPWEEGYGDLEEEQEREDAPRPQQLTRSGRPTRLPERFRDDNFASSATLHGTRPIPMYDMCAVTVPSLDMCKNQGAP
jgi:hypothetical protein